MQWYYGEEGESIGPVEEEELVRMAEDGRLKPTDYVWNATMGSTWVQASTVDALFDPPAPAPAPAGPDQPTAQPTRPWARTTASCTELRVACSDFLLRKNP